VSLTTLSWTRQLSSTCALLEVLLSRHTVNTPPPVLPNSPRWLVAHSRPLSVRVALRGGKPFSESLVLSSSLSIPASFRSSFVVAITHRPFSIFFCRWYKSPQSYLSPSIAINTLFESPRNVFGTFASC
jgi:hypothetical protein